jgi:hypothetical protein
VTNATVGSLQAEARGIKQRLDPSLLRKSSEKSEHSWLVVAWFTAEDLEYNRVVCQSADLSTLLGVFTNSLAATLCWQGMLAGHKVATEKVGVLFRSWEVSDYCCLCFLMLCLFTNLSWIFFWQGCSLVDRSWDIFVDAGGFGSENL